MNEDRILIVPEQHYIGYKARHPSQEDKDFLCFMIPWADKPDKAMLKRQESVDEWAKVKGAQHILDWKTRESITIYGRVEIQKNVPMKGYSFTGVDRRYRTNNAFLRVRDPRGFELEISIENLLWIMERVTIKNGVIEDELIWAKWKDSPYNILCPTDHEDYIKAVKNTKALKEKKMYVPGKDLKPGYKVKLATGDEVIYMGEMYPTVVHSWWEGDYHTWSRVDNRHERSRSIKSQRLFHVVKSESYGTVQYHLYVSLPKILHVLETNEVTQTSIERGSSHIWTKGNSNIESFDGIDLTKVTSYSGPHERIVRLDPK